MPREAAQEQGRVGAATAKRWLEATTFLEFPWNSYKNGPMCEVQCLDGSPKVFDLAGFFLDKVSTPASVEVKNVTTESHLEKQYHEFLAVAYSSTARRLRDSKEDDLRRFLWVSWHPFGPMTKWNQRESADEIRRALEANPDLLGGEAIEASVLSLVSERVWLLTFNGKQEQICLKPKDLAKAVAVLKRKKGSL